MSSDFTMQDTENISFADETLAGENIRKSAPEPPWRVLVVDDEQEVHDVTSLALRQFSFADRSLEFMHAYSAVEAKRQLLKHKDIAVVLLDVVMEHDAAGLEVIQYIREELGNPFIRIILRTGQPGHAPERQVVSQYDINDYRAKTELTAQKLFTTMIGALRSYRAEATLFKEKERIQVTLRSIADGVITTDAANCVHYINPAAEEIIACLEEDAIGKPLGQIMNLVDEHTLTPLPDIAEETLRTGQMVHRAHNVVLLHADGKKIAIEAKSTPIHNETKECIGSVIAFRDVTKARDLAHKLAWQANHDPLTGLVNRREFEHRLETLLYKQQDESPPGHHCVLYIDLDKFKIVNDTCGHSAGDELLKQLSLILQTKIRHTDTLARLGGDEFGVLLEECPFDKAHKIAENLRTGVEAFRFVWDNRSFNIGASIGLVQITNASDNVANILSAADVACYAAKEDSGNCVHVYRENNADLVKRQREKQWATRLTKAISGNNFLLYCQPIVPLSPLTPKENYFEILVRMQDEEGRIVSPNSFIPAAERYKLMPDIDRWVIQTLCNQYQKQPDSGEKWMYSINISGTSLSDVNFTDFVCATLKEYGLPGEMLCFEVTETSALANIARANRFARKIKKLGCHFALDDFGSGLSSFSYLKEFPLDYLKIDGSFVKDVAEDPIDYAMVDAINQIGHLMGLKTIAEYAESKAVLEELKKIGVDYAQGHGIAPAQPLGEMFLPFVPS